MNKDYISSQLRRLVEERASRKCEYCQVPEAYSFGTSYHIDHIIGRQHGGPTIESNLAYSCPMCNLAKGSNISTWLAKQDLIVRLYHPRLHKWQDHFELSGDGIIFPLTDIATGTIKLLELNGEASVAIRESLLLIGILKTSSNSPKG